MLLVLEPVERLTTALRRGDAFSEKAVIDMQALSQRLKAFDQALSDRIAVVMEDE